MIRWGLASGIVVFESVFALLREALVGDNRWLVVSGLLAGVVLAVVGHRLVSHSEIDPRQDAEADFRKLVLIPGILTVHSFPEGLGAGADLPRGRRPELVAGLLVGVLAMVPLASV